MVEETCDEWFARFTAHREELGQYTTTPMWRRWISPHIGSKRWADVTPEAVEEIRDVLDRAIVARRLDGPAKGRLLARSAIDVWGMLVTAARTARMSKRRDLRVLAGKPNPCADVQPPGERGARRSRKKTFIYPVEFLRLASCKRVPRSWRELHTIAVYTYLRPGELMVLRWSDVDLGQLVIRVTKAWHYERRETKAPKTAAGVRDVPIHPRLVPLLQRMRDAARPEELVAPTLSEVHRVTIPQLTRRHLELAGVTRSSLHDSSDVTVQANFRTWRDTGITWLAMSGVDVARIMRRAGHDDVRATMRYIKMAEDLSGRLGKPFPPLPKELVYGRGGRALS